MAKPILKTGSYTGTGAAVNVSLGFIPDYVRVINRTDKDAGMTAFRRSDTGAFENTAEGAALAPQASNGISAFAGSASAPMGFTAGTAVSVNGKVYDYVAMRSDV